VYLWMEKYNEAIAACDKVINSGRFGLVNNFYTSLFVNGNSNEGIFELQFDRLNVNVQFYDMFRTRPRFIPSGKVMEEIYMTDALDDTKKDIRGDGASIRADINQIWKYTGIDFNTARAREESIAHWYIYRFADVLLMKAEALAMVNKGEEALALVYRVRNRANALAGTDRAPQTSDTQAILDFILEERAREFAYEGKRWYDLLRHAKRNNYQRLDILLGIVAGSVEPSRQQSAIAKFKDVNSHYFPIYDYELQTDKALVQNPFYK
jgi:starch-binding outer membrane protein, SusD/RagB family